MPNTIDRIRLLGAEDDHRHVAVPRPPGSPSRSRRRGRARSRGRDRGGYARRGPAPRRRRRPAARESRRSPTAARGTPASRAPARRAAERLSCSDASNRIAESKDVLFNVFATIVPHLAAVGGVRGRRSPGSLRSHAPLPEPRSEVAATVARGEIVVVGGLHGGRRRLRARGRLLDRRRARARLPMPVAVDHAAAASANGRVYIAGGYGRGRAPAVEPAFAPTDVTAKTATITALSRRRTGNVRMITPLSSRYKLRATAGHPKKPQLAALRALGRLRAHRPDGDDVRGDEQRRDHRARLQHPLPPPERLRRSRDPAEDEGDDLAGARRRRR